MELVGNLFQPVLDVLIKEQLDISRLEIKLTHPNQQREGQAVQLEIRRGGFHGDAACLTDRQSLPGSQNSFSHQGGLAGKGLG